MAAFAIHVKGEAEIPHPAERAVVDITITTDGLDKTTVSEDAQATAEIVEALLRDFSPSDGSEEAKNSAALNHWSRTSLSTSSYQPTDSHGRTMTEAPRRYKATMQFSARFQNFTRLGSFNRTLSELPNVQISQINWVLTEATKKSFHSQLRKIAARDALLKASEYADALGYKNVKPVELRAGGNTAQSRHMKAGMIFGSNSSGNLPQNMVEQQGRESGGEDRFMYQPEDVMMNLSVSAEFHAE